MTTMTRRGTAALATITPGVNINYRRPMQQRTLKAIVEAATALGAVACPVLTRTGGVDEVHLFRNEALRASIFVPTTGRIGIWRSNATANTPVEAVRRALDPLRKHTRNLAIAA